MGTDFESRMWIQLLWDGSPLGMPSVRTNGESRLSAEVTIPGNSKVGEHTLSAMAGKPGGIEEASG